MATKVLKPEKQESSKNSSWDFVYNATPDEIQEMAKPNFGTIFGLQLYTISSSSTLHNIYKSLFNFMLVAPASS